MTPIRGRSRTNTLRGRSSSAGSRPSDLNRIYSAGAFDDHYAVYHEDHNHGDEGFAGDADADAYNEKQEQDDSPQGSSDQTRVNSREKDKDGAEDDDEESHESHEEEEEYEVVPEVRMGVLDHRDVEKHPNMEKSKSRASSKGRDPNLVGWDGPDDPENPKVCLSSLRFRYLY